MSQRTSIALIVLTAWLGPVLRAAEPERGLAVSDRGWLVINGRGVWGYAQHNGWWRDGQRPNLARNSLGEIGPNRTEDLDKLTDAMLRFGYPGFEHNFGLWYDRRRDRHDQARRRNGNVVPPFLEQPWARSEQGTAWDGLPKYDLSKYNDWYFARLGEFARLCDQKGTILLHNFYMQHALLETNAHYVDFPWREANCIQISEMPDRTPAANEFYDVSHPVRRKLHEQYIRKCLDVLGDHKNVIHLVGQEYTGPRSFVEFWLETVFNWETETGKDVHIALGACKDVMDAVLADESLRERIDTIDLRYWWYEVDGTLFAPKGGSQVAGRYIGQIGRTTPEQIYRQVTEYRTKYPGKAILHGLAGSRQHAWAALMGGASLIVGQLPYPDMQDPMTYVSPQLCEAIQPTYDFVRNHVSDSLPRMRSARWMLGESNGHWCLADADRTFLIYMLNGGTIRLEVPDGLGAYSAIWFDPRTGERTPAIRSNIQGGGGLKFSSPDARDWVLQWSKEV